MPEGMQSQFYLAQENVLSIEVVVVQLRFLILSSPVQGDSIMTMFLGTT